MSHPAAFDVRTGGILFRLGAILVGILILLSILGVVVYLSGWQLWASYHYRAAMKAIARRDFEVAEAHLALYLEVRPHTGEVQWEAARAARRAGRYRDAERYLKACKDLKWVPEATELEYVLLQIQRGNLGANEQIALDWVQRGHPDSVLILEALAQGYQKNFDLSRVIDCLSLLLFKEPDHVQALIWRGDAYERMRILDKALEDYRRALELHPNHDEARLLLAQLLINGHHAVDAVGHFEKLYEKTPDDPPIVMGLAKCRHEMGKFDEAVQLFDLILKINPRDAIAMAERGNLAMQLGDYKDAESWLLKAAKLAPYERDVVYFLVQCLEHQGKEQESKPWRARLDQIEADLDRLKAVLAKIRTTPQDPASRLEAAKLFLQNGQDKEGLRWLKSALQQDPTHQPTRDFLADYYEKRGNKHLARQYRRSQSSEPTDRPNEANAPLIAPGLR